MATSSLRSEYSACLDSGSGTENSNTSPGKSTTSSPSSSNIDIPTSTPHFVDKLGIRFYKEDILKIILNRWCLIRLSSDSRTKVDTLVNACDFKFDYEAIEDIPPRKGKYEKLKKKWSPDDNQMMTLRLNENKGMVSVNWLSVKLHEISFCLHSIISETPKKAVSEWKYQTLFEKLLQLFCFDTLSQPFIETEKALLMGHTISSKADIICSRLDTKFERPIICVCETITEKEDASCPPRKKMKPDVAVTSKTKDDDTTSSRTYFDDHNLWAQHIGELLVYLDKSFRYDGILGITIEKTWVRFTYLEVSKTTIKKIKERPANRAGSLEVDEDERPIFCYSERYNYLNRKDRKIIFKVLILIKKMQSDYEKIQ